MENSETSTQLLKDKYDDLHKTQAVDAAALGHERRTGEKVAQDPLARIENFLAVWHERFSSNNPRGTRNLERITDVLHNKYIVKPNEIPEGYFENQRRLAKEQGHGDIEISPQMRAQLIEVIITDQTSSMDKWIDYLASSDAPYPDALKYWTLRSVLNMGEYNKERHAYPQRSKGTTKPFPDLNREAYAYVINAVDKKYHGEKHYDPEFSKLLQGENFAKLYAWAIEKVTPASPEELSATKGEWVKYNKNSDPIPLVQSLQGHGTGWCTAGELTARTQLQGGDFYVYYSFDKDGKPTTPRAAIRMEDNRIAEVRGIAPEQNLDSGAVTVVEEKLKEFPDGASYKKKVSDMGRLTNIENQIKMGQQSTGEDLVFLYEIDSSIEGFGFEKDPRIEEIRSRRNPVEDMPIIFGCSRDQIATTINEIRSDTKAYVGPLQTGIFDRLKNVEHVYTSFPEGKIRRQAVEIGGKSKDQLKAELKTAGVSISSYADDMLNSPDFITLKNPQTLDTVRLQVQDLGLKDYPTTDQVYARAKELGLELCPAEVGPHLRLKDADQFMGDWYFIGMKQIADRDGGPGVFRLERSGGGMWLNYIWAKPGSKWFPKHGFVFSLRKSETQNAQTPGLLNRIFRR